MVIKLFSVAITGIDAEVVEVELDAGPGQIAYKIIGLPDNAVRESMDRVLSALKNGGYDYPRGRVVVNLAPAELRKEGAFYDLPIAIAMAMATGGVVSEKAGDYLIVGELSLNGELRPVRGALATAITAKQRGFKGVIVPVANAAEAGVLADEVEVVAVENLSQTIGFLTGDLPAPALPEFPIPDDNALPDNLCYSDVRGQESVKRALEVAAAGGHNLLMLGPPGSGKTMCAQRLPTILPELTFAESLEVTKIYSVAGELRPGQGLLRRRPFRSPHHSASIPGLIGGGTTPHPGEISLAHHGVLFLDEAPEFPRPLLETLRQPLEDGCVTISRAAGSCRYPASIMLVLAMNMCPCGKTGTRQVCHCHPLAIERYVGRLSAPLLDRIDIHVEAPLVKYDELRGQRTGETSAAIRERVTRARAIQQQRFGPRPDAVNARMRPADLEKFCALDEECESLLKTAVTEIGLSARACGRVLKVARTIADLAQSERITEDHLSEAIQYRVLDRKKTY